ncbi:MAG: endonuclease/exonuclease/phosphatase family protein, partial [Nocardioidaceae bacterium]
TAGVLDLEHTAGVIADLDVDVIGLQEVDRYWSERSAFTDQAAFLAERLAMQMVFGASLDRAGRTDAHPRRQYGNALLSRFPVLDARSTLLPRRRTSEQRTLLEVRIVVGDVPLRCLNTQWQHRSGTARMAQAEATTAKVDDRDDPTVLVGDLNAGPDTPEVRTLTEHLADVWPTRGEGDGYTYGAQAPRRRIDYVLASPDIDVRHACVTPTKASDHLPVTADLRLS